MEDFDFNPFYEHTVRIDGLPDVVLQGIKDARKKAKAAGGLIPIVKIIGGRGQAVYVVTCREFNDSRRYERLHRNWIENILNITHKRK